MRSIHRLLSTLCLHKERQWSSDRESCPLAHSSARRLPAREMARPETRSQSVVVFGCPPSDRNRNTTKLHGGRFGTSGLAEGLSLPANEWPESGEILVQPRLDCNFPSRVARGARCCRALKNLQTKSPALPSGAFAVLTAQS